MPRSQAPLLLRNFLSMSLRISCVSSPRLGLRDTDSKNWKNRALGSLYCSACLKIPSTAWSGVPSDSSRLSSAIQMLNFSCSSRIGIFFSARLATSRALLGSFSDAKYAMYRIHSSDEVGDAAISCSKSLGHCGSMLSRTARSTRSISFRSAARRDRELTVGSSAAPWISAATEVLADRNSLQSKDDEKGPEAVKSPKSRQ